MGKNKGKSSAPAPAPTPAAGAGAGDKPKGRKQRGHRQKGAGTVVTSRGEITVAGVTLKEWQRTPVKLLQEYCQSVKRPMPQFQHGPRGKSEKGSRFRVKLPDPKRPGTDRDLSFLPQQCFPNPNEAKHAVSLLALYHVCKERPLERKLPDPYKAMWLSLVKDGPGTGAGGIAAFDNKKAAAAPRAPPAPPAPTAAAAFADSWDAPTTHKEARPAPPKEPAVVLTSAKRFVSDAEKKRVEHEKARQRAERDNVRNARNAANKEPTVMMSDVNRMFVEGVLAAFFGGREGGPADSKPAASQEELAAVMKALRKLGFSDHNAQLALEKRGADVDAALDWLCLNLPEGELPKQFDPRGKQLDVVVPLTDDSPTASMDPSVRALMAYGFRASDVQQALHSAKGSVSDACVALHSALCELVGVDTAPDAALSEDPDTEATEEVDMLEAIYAEDFATRTDSGWRVLTVKLGEVPGTRGGVTLEVRYPVEVPPGVPPYPNTPPLAFVRSDVLSPSARLAGAAALARECASRRGAPVVYELGVWLAEGLAGAMSSLATVVDRHLLSVPGGDSPVVAVPVPAAAGAGSSASKPGGRRGAGRRQFKRSTHDSGASLDKARAFKARIGKDSKHASMQRQRAGLPVASYKDEFLRLVARNQVVLVSGQTGCGKTTQVPQFILDHAADSGAKTCRIVCTQPRRIAAIGVATRVAQERCERLGEFVGFQIRGESKTCADTCLTFATTGVLLRQLQGGFGTTTHIIVDEVHERNVDTDFLLAILKRTLRDAPHVKLILMSATMDASSFAAYFAAGRGPCPTLEVPGRTFPVEEVYLDDMAAMVSLPIQLPKKKDMGLSDEEFTALSASKTGLVRSQGFADAFHKRNNMDVSLLAAVVCEVCTLGSRLNATVGDGAVLVFLPGVMEIRKLERAIGRRAEAAVARGMQVLPLHGALSGDDQSRVFRRPPAGVRKVVLSTNVAETSITIDDVVAVIDTGRVKETQYDPVNKMSRLVEGWVSRAAADQRRGRAGRVRAGVCFRVFPRLMLGAMAAQPVPEIRRTPLEQLCLQLKLLKLGAIATFLAGTLDPPAPAMVTSAVNQLLDLGALAPAGNTRGAAAREDWTLTPLGHHLALLPMDVRLGKALVFGAMLRCLDPVLTIVAGMSVRSPFRAPHDEMDAARRAHRAFAVPRSDHLTLVAVYERWRTLSGWSAKRDFCKQSYLSFETMRSIDDLRRDYAAILRDIGFLPGGGGAGGRARRDRATVAIMGHYGEAAPPFNTCSEDPAVVKSALCAGLYPNVMRCRRPIQKYNATTAGAVKAKASSKEFQYYVLAASAGDVGLEPSGGAGAPPGDGLRITVYRGIPQVRVFMHPASVNFHEAEMPTPWLVFHEKAHTSKLFIRDCSMVTPYALLLFGGAVTVQHTEGTLTVGKEKWIQFKAAARVGVLVKELRRALDALLTDKIQDPTLDITSNPVIDAILKLLESSGL